MPLPVIVVNYSAVLVASIVGIVISFIWFGPIFGKTWMKIMKVSPKDMAKGKKNMPRRMLCYFVALLVMNFVLANLLGFVGAVSVADALSVGFVTWLGFIATVLFAGFLWEKTHGKLFAINTVHYLILLLVSSWIITAMTVRVIIVP